MALTHQVMIVPESFLEMNKDLDVHLENNKVVTTDVFADVFAVVAMNKSYLSDHNDLIRFFPVKVLDLFERYFTELIDYAFGNREELKIKKHDIIWFTTARRAYDRSMREFAALVPRPLIPEILRE